MMNGNDVLIDLLEDNRRRLQRRLDTLNEDCLYWRPEPEANNIAVTMWHMARILDVFVNRQAQGKAPADECWFKGGWVECTGYDPRGIGQNGWGMLTGYTQEEVAALPDLMPADLLRFLNEVYDAVHAYVEQTPMDELLTPAAGFDGRYTKYQCVQMALMDNVRHLGEIYAITAAWERNQTRQ